jgi:hypothetical protein
MFNRVHACYGSSKGKTGVRLDEAGRAAGVRGRRVLADWWESWQGYLRSFSRSALIALPQRW